MVAYSTGSDHDQSSGLPKLLATVHVPSEPVRDQPVKSLLPERPGQTGAPGTCTVASDFGSPDDWYLVCLRGGIGKTSCYSGIVTE